MAKIVVVEDSLSQAHQLKLILQHQKHDVRQAANGEEALSLIADDKPEVIVSDVLMPKMNGYELCRRVKDDSELRDISIILLTTLSDMGDVLNGLECGADSFVSKPYSEEEILHHIDHILTNRILRGQKHIDGATEVFFEKKRYLFSARRIQTINFLFSIFTHSIDKNKELVRKNEELRRALQTIKTLRGLIPICAWCKKIRDDDGFWQSVEEYMTEHSDASFTHGLCTECMEREFPEEADEKD